MARPENWILKVEIDGDEMTINGVPVLKKEDQQEIRDRWTEEQAIWDEAPKKQNERQTTTSN